MWKKVFEEHFFPCMFRESAADSVLRVLEADLGGLRESGYGRAYGGPGSELRLTLATFTIAASSLRSE